MVEEKKDAVKQEVVDNKEQNLTKEQRINMAYNTMIALVEREIKLGLGDILKIVQEREPEKEKK